LDGKTSDPQATTLPSFTIYEMWCFLAVTRQLQTIMPDWSWSSTGLKNLLKTTGTGAGAWVTGQHDEHGDLQILFNPTFAGFLSRKSSTRWSLSGERRPDLIVTYRPAQGQGTWLALDAKYRAGKSNLSEAFESAHIYRDALRHDNFGGPCLASMLLAPACTPEVSPWFSAEFRDAHQCGIWELRPGVATDPELGRWIVETLLIGHQGVSTLRG